MEAAVALLRRHGPTKVTVIDVARALGMSHGNIYRHFASKAELFDAIAERWLHTVSDPLEAIAAAPQPAAVRLEAWVLTLMHLKLHKLQDDPELFAVYHAVAEEARGVVAQHVATLLGQLERIIAEGVVLGEFTLQEQAAAARAVLNATMPFHHPALLTTVLPAEAEARAVLALLVAGLRSGSL